jgi:arylsulfotransferase ASST
VRLRGCLVAAGLIVSGAPVPDAPAATRACRLESPRFHTHPEFRPVGMCVSHRAERSTAAGNLFLTPWRSRTSEDAAMALTRDGRLLWYRPSRHGLRDLKVVRYGGRRLLAYFDWGLGAYSLLDGHYHEIGRIHTLGHRTDMHELQLTSQGTAYVASYFNTRRRGTGESIREYMIQEVDIRTGARLFTWRASDHVAPSASYAPRPRGRVPWDFFHGNSIEPPKAGDPTIVVSARNTSSVYGIDRRTGRVRWILGGKEDQFGVARHRGWQFCGQHDARRIRGGITLFDNGAIGACPRHAARALRYRLDLRRKAARLVQHLPSTAVEGVQYFTWGLGSARRQKGGHVLVSWGSVPQVTELTPRGRLVFGVRLGSNTYRAVRAIWYGRPTEPPAVAARRSAHGTDVWASWNGATNVGRWRVLTGSAPDALRRVRPTTRWADFETTIHLPTRPAYVAVRALDWAGHAVGESAAVKVG